MFKKIAIYAGFPLVALMAMVLMARATTASCPNVTLNLAGTPTEWITCAGNAVMDGGTTTWEAADGGTTVVSGAGVLVNGVPLSLSYVPAVIPNTEIAYGGPDAGVTGSANLTYSSNDLRIISQSGSDALDVLNTDAGVAFGVNTTTGYATATATVASSAGVQIYNYSTAGAAVTDLYGQGSGYLEYGVGGSSYLPGNAAVTGRAYLYTNNANGMSFVNQTGGDIRFYNALNATDFARFVNAGRLLLNTTTDDGVDRLQVGGAIVTGLNSAGGNIIDKDNTSTNGIIRMLPSSGSGWNRGFDAFQDSTETRGFGMYTIATDNWVTQSLAPINLWTSGNNPVPISLAMSAKGTGVNSSVTAVDVAIEIPANTNRVLINLLPDAGGDNGTDALQVNGSAAVQTDPITSKQVVNLETLQSYTGGSPTANWDGGTGWSRLPPNTANTVWRIPFSEFADAGFSSSTGITGGGFYWELNGSQGDGYGGLYGVLGSSSLPGYAFFFDSNNSGSPGGLVGVIPYYTDGGFTADGGGMQLTGDVSMSFWFSPISSIETIGSILFLGSNNVTSAFGIGYKGSNGSITAYITSSDRLVSSYCTYSVVGPFLISEGTNTIYFIAETYNHLTGIATLYIDGNLACQSGSVLEPDGGGGNFTYNGTWFLGDSGPGGGNYWRGYMWDPDLETQTNWTQAQVQQRMNIYFGR